MKQLDDVRTLQRYKQWRNKDEIKLFITALKSIERIADPSILPELFMIVSDEDIDIHAEQEIETTIGKFALETIVSHIFQLLPKLRSEAPEWTNHYCTRLLSADDTEHMFREHYLNSNKSTQDILQSVFQEVEHEFAQHEILFDGQANEIDKVRERISKKIKYILQ